MIRKMAMLGLVAGFLALGACDDCGDCDAAATEGAAVQTEGGSGGLAASATSGGVAADGTGGPLVCPVSGSGGSGDCSSGSSCCEGMAACDDVLEDCSGAQQDCETQCEEKQCDDTPIAPSVSD